MNVTKENLGAPQGVGVVGVRTQRDGSVSEGVPATTRFGRGSG